MRGRRRGYRSRNPARRQIIGDGNRRCVRARRTRPELQPQRIARAVASLLRSARAASGFPWPGTMGPVDSFKRFQPGSHGGFGEASPLKKLSARNCRSTARDSARRNPHIAEARFAVIELEIGEDRRIKCVQPVAPISRRKKADLLGRGGGRRDRDRLSGTGARASPHLPPTSMRTWGMETPRGPGAGNADCVPGSRSARSPAAMCTARHSPSSPRAPSGRRDASITHGGGRG